MPNAVEIELKFQVPAAARAAVRRAVAAGSAQRTRLQAVYADSDDDRLAAAGLALRLRQEGPAWVQTLKGRGDGLLQRLEHEVPLPPQPGTPALDPSRHAGSAAGVALAAALQGAELKPLYRTDILRLHRLLRRGGACIEVAFDEGHIRAAGQESPVCELEFELKSGSPSALLEVAAAWVRRHGLWLDVRTKSERGFRLARGLTLVPAVRAQALAYGPAVERHQVLAAALQSSLAQALPNAAEIAAGNGRPEHLHQLRVALRRLRTALRLLGGWGADRPAAEALEQALRPWFGHLGAARDDDAIEAAFGAQLQAAGAPPWRPAAPTAAQVDIAALLRDPRFSLLLLDALQLAQLPPPTLPAGQASLREAAAEVLQAAWRRALRDAGGFAGAPPELQHRLRKRLKRLRYGAEFLLPLFALPRTRRLMKPLRVAMEALGGWHDLQVAQAWFAARGGDDARAWFACGWLAAQQPRQTRRCVKALRALADAPRFWR